jgi:ComF family protein
MQHCFAGDCLLCGAAAPSGSLCHACHTSLPHHDVPACPSCALPTTDGSLCGHCLKKAPHFARTLAAFTYAFPVDALIQALKYGSNLAAAGPLAQPLVQRVMTQTLPDLLIPMPLHPSRLKERGFNQSAEIAKILAHKLRVPIALDACSKVRDTAPQASLPLKERGSNVKGAFRCNMDLSGKRVALVDDVMTSGATLNELAKTLAKQGAAEISAWVVARAL